MPGLTCLALLIFFGDTFDTTRSSTTRALLPCLQRKRAGCDVFPSSNRYFKLPGYTLGNGSIVISLWAGYPQVGRVEVRAQKVRKPSVPDGGMAQRCADFQRNRRFYAKKSIRKGPSACVDCAL